MMTKIYKIFIQSKVYKKLKAKQSSHVFIPLIKTRQTKKVRKKEVSGRRHLFDGFGGKNLESTRIFFAVLTGFAVLS